jgi:hypothetical protein
LPGVWPGFRLAVFVVVDPAMTLVVHARKSAWCRRAATGTVEWCRELVS